MAYRDDLDLTANKLDAYLDDVLQKRMPVVQQQSMAVLADELGIDELIQSGGLQGDRLAQFLDTYLNNAFHIQHPANMGHQVSCPHPSGAIGGFVDAFTNNPMAIYEKGPAAATIEYALINWMLGKVGWRPSPYPGDQAGGAAYGGGVLTHGGSLAQLTALAAARSHADPDIWERGNNPDLVVIAPHDAHYSVSRALGILGMGQGALVSTPCDAQGSIVPDQLVETIENTKKRGKQLMAV
ncbi:MAG: diaminobutyrate decarboxylase, partial [Deltaproteobacteria bacterium]